MIDFVKKIFDRHLIYYSILKKSKINYKYNKIYNMMIKRKK